MMNNTMQTLAGALATSFSGALALVTTPTGDLVYQVSVPTPPGTLEDASALVRVAVTTSGAPLVGDSDYLANFAVPVRGEEEGSLPVYRFHVWDAEADLVVLCTISLEGTPTTARVVLRFDTV